ncbi:alpha/beta fold hydrolase [Streptomyces sp. NPDC057638]|uniref:alpha/beta fold hydrolase n=1 Tax=Streptomyces sp. NPDC057638 TaxID=3346190 RepID=UPI0036A3A4F8
MARRIDVTGAGGVRLAAWEFGDPPKGGTPARGEGTGDPPVGGPPAGGAGSAAGVVAGSGEGGAEGEVPGLGSAADPPGALLLHGLMGRAAHWASAARWLSGRYRTVALDQRGHGRSEKPSDGPFSREAYVADAEAALEQLGLGPAVVIGHSMGALTAWQLAARRPDLVRALVICDMRASALGAASQRVWEEWFRAWPLPFATLADVRKWFGEDDPWEERPTRTRGDFYAEVMAEREDGWRPVFSRRQMLSSRATWVHDAHWEELAQVRCPALVVRGIDGELGRAEAQEMVRVLPRGVYAEVPDAGHLAHYDHPEAWRAVVDPFLSSLPDPG